MPRLGCIHVDVVRVRLHGMRESLRAFPQFSLLEDLGNDIHDLNTSFHLFRVVPHAFPKDCDANLDLSPAKKREYDQLNQ